MLIRRAENKDILGINKLLRQVLDIHHNGRPDIFKANAKKYTDGELEKIIADESRPIFVCEDGGNILGYAFCMFTQHKDNNILTDIKSLYIDDICIDENERGKHIGKELFLFVKDYARESCCYNITLNVWSCNEGAYAFYEKCGFIPQKTVMEQIL